jgi:hypothetical protein
MFTFATDDWTAATVDAVLRLRLRVERARVRAARGARWEKGRAGRRPCERLYFS